MIKEPIKTIKCKLKKILRSNSKINYAKFYECIKRTNTVTFVGYHFLRYFILYCVKYNKNIPDINHKFIKQIFKSICNEERDPKCKNINTELGKQCKKFLKIIGISHKFYKTNLSYMINYEETSIITAFNNNIKLNFPKYVNQYIS